MSQTITEMLAKERIRHKPSIFPGKRDLYHEDGGYLGAFDAHEAFVYLICLNNFAAVDA